MLDIERYVNELAVWDQILRTGEEPMETETMDNTLLRDRGVGTEGLLRATATLSRIGAWSMSVTMLFFIWRSGDEVSDGGHMTVPSIGHVIPSSSKMAVPFETDRSGTAHIIPITWQRAKASTSAIHCLFIRGIIEPSTPWSTAPPTLCTAFANL